MSNTINTDPRENEKRAWEILVNPREHSKIDVKHLLERGIAFYGSKNGFNKKRLVQDIEKFTRESTRTLSAERYYSGKKSLKHISTDYTKHPGRLALVGTLSALVTKRHEAIRDDHRLPKIDKHIYQIYLYFILQATRTSDFSVHIQQTMGELVYGRDQEDKRGPPPGRPVEGITRLEDRGNRIHFKVPIAQASRQCMEYDDDGNLDIYISGKYIYVPSEYVIAKYTRYFFKDGNVPYKIEDTLKNILSEAQIESYLEEATVIQDRISYLADSNKSDALFEKQRYPPDLKVMLMAVKRADSAVANIGDPVTASEVREALVQLRETTDMDWVKGVIDKLDTSTSVGSRLSTYAENDEDDGGSEHVSIEEGGENNRYVLEYRINDFKVVDVTGIGDLLEIPCFNSLHESLMQSKPVRWELYSFVRYVFEIDGVDFGIEDIKTWFEQYPWYREDITEYQISYEENQKIGGDRPLPISCNNDNQSWTEHCIGKENCEYSLYQSVELKPDVYDRLGRD